MQEPGEFTEESWDSNEFELESNLLDDDLDESHDPTADESSGGPCPSCSGSGVDSSQNDEGYQQPCPGCGGTGQAS